MTQSSNPVEGSKHVNQENQITFYEDGVLAIKVQAGKPPTIVIPYDCTFVEVFLKCETAPLVQAIIVDVNLNGASLFAVHPAYRPLIAVLGMTGTTFDFDTTIGNKDDQLTFDIDQVGVGTTGASLTANVRIKRR